MAKFDFNPKRPCIVKGDTKALFHCWFQVSEIVAPSVRKGGHAGGVISGVLGLVEYEDGTVHKILPENIQFLDNNIFNDYDFEESNDEHHP